MMERMEATGVDLFIDVHGDEEIPFNFLAGQHYSQSYSSLVARICSSPQGVCDASRNPHIAS